MANLRIGSSGEEVRKLQTALGFTGNDVDGIFGQKTDKAVRDYQAANGLQVDGIAGQNTLGKLYGTGTTVTGTANSPATTVNPSAPVTSQAGFTYGDFQYEDFKPSDAVQQANALIQQQQASRPGAWVDQYQDKWMGYLNQYENRDPFSYNFNSDALYQQYKDQYIRQGQLAMMDTMGQAAAMTGGYGNSYAQTVGQQAYNQQLGQLNQIMPELYGMAYDRYQQEGQNLLNQYNLYKGLSEQSYSQHQDDVDNWYREMSRLTDDYNAQYSREYEDYLLGRNTAYDEYQTDRSEALAKWKADTGNSGADDAGWRNVSSTSIEEIVNTVYKYGQKGENDLMESYLDGLVGEGRISQDYADELYAKYRSDKDPDVFGTGVDLNYSGSGGGPDRYFMLR